MRPLLEPRLIDPSANEPGLVVDMIDERRALLFDLADLTRLPPRVLLRVSHAFITHTHMDHFAGFDHLLAVGLGRMRRVVLWGGPGFVAQVEHKLRAYTWNVVHRYDVPLLIDAREVEPGGGRRCAMFASATAFARSGDSRWHAEDDVLHDELTLRVRARFVDHETPVLAFALEEKARVRVAPDRLKAMGLTTGAWLRDLKHAVLSGAPPDTPITLRWRDRAGEHADVRSVAELQSLVLDVVAGRRIGYVTDLRYADDNVEQLTRLLDGVDLLYIESVFHDDERAHAERKNHLMRRRPARSRGACVRRRWCRSTSRRATKAARGGSSNRRWRRGARQPGDAPHRRSRAGAHGDAASNALHGRRRFRIKLACP